jgi:16S rRNA (cytidine1402-2'-O)-methyltransferase
MLYIVGTPIGNLRDLSLRQAETIHNAKVVLCEDTRSTVFLIQKIRELFGFTENKDHELISYYKDKEFEKLPRAIETLEEGRDIVLISQAGMPLISDPGSLLVREVIRRNIPYTVIPGPTAATTAVIHSGFPFRSFLFCGFLPKKESDVKRSLARSKRASDEADKCLCVFYETANRIQSTLGIISEMFPTAQVCVCRELTKLHEESVRGTAGELKNREFRGEIVLVVAYGS